MCKMRTILRPLSRTSMGIHMKESVCSIAKPPNCEPDGLALANYAQCLFDDSFTLIEVSRPSISAPSLC